METKPVSGARSLAVMRTRRYWVGVSLRTRFLLGVGVMLLPLVNLAAAAWFSLTRMDAAARHLVTTEAGTGAGDLAVIAAVRNEALIAVVGVCVAGIVVAAVAGRSLARAVLRPLAEIRTATERLGQGELGYRVSSQRVDELGVVAAAFDAMAEQLQRSQEDLAHGAMHDPLTGLANRRLLQGRLQQSAGQSGVRALLLIDLDDFKGINDSLGHPSGDQVLIEVGKRLVTAVSESGVCARLGGDEFAVLLEGVASFDHALERARALREVIREPIPVTGRSIVLDASIGVVPDLAGRGPDLVLRDADLAMYAAKRAGGGRAEPFTPALHQQAIERLELEAELRQALERGELRPHYQPVVDLGSGRLTGVEALVRWAHPRRGLLAPAQFVPLAEESDLIVALGEQVLHTACTDVAEHIRAHPHLKPLTLSVNLSARQLQQPDLTDVVHGALQASGLPAHLLTLEITETVMMDDPQSSAARMQALVDLGVRLAVDDFGTGYSSLAYLQRFPVHTLKVDKSFVASLDLDRSAVVLTGAVVHLARALGLHVVAEGVERPAQARILEEVGCAAVQGYLFGRPGPLRDLADRAEVHAALRP